jgi:parallel beta-helix repeat protein
VKPGGDDLNAGTSPDLPLKTVAAAALKLTPGSVVYVGRGTYAGRVNITNVAGTAEMPVQLIADRDGTHTGSPDGEVTLDAGGDLAGLIITNSPFTTVDGFFLRGAKPSETQSVGTAIRIRGRSNHATISNCVIVNADPATGIRVDNSDDVQLFNNLVFSADRGIVITGNSDGTQVVNNTVALSTHAGLSAREADMEQPRNTRVVNNVFEDNGPGVALELVAHGSGYEGDRNLVFQPALEDQALAYNPPDRRGEHDVNSEARFANINVGDVHLESDSPAIDAGTGLIDDALEDDLLTRSSTVDGARDRSPIDLGYHYPRD